MIWGYHYFRKQPYVLVLFVSCTDGVGGGVGWTWLHALSWHTCWMLRNCTYMFHATQLYVPVLFASCTDGVGGGVGVVACVVLTRMLDATQLHVHVSCYATVRARTVRITHGLGGWAWYAAAHTCFIPRMRITQICSRSAAHKWPRCDTRETSE